MSILAVFLVAGLGTYLFRVSMILAPADLSNSTWLQERLGLLSPAVLAAIVASALFVSAGDVVAPNPVELAAVVVALVAVFRTGNISAALLFGLPVYWLGALTGLA